MSLPSRSLSLKTTPHALHKSHHQYGAGLPFYVLHGSTAARKKAIRNVVFCPTDLIAASVKKLRHPFVLESLRSTETQTKPLTVSAPIMSHVLTMGHLIHGPLNPWDRYIAWIPWRFVLF